ncbi:hypothetical protein [Nocardia puris]|uniref:hypothetical protein n=1 Tax=Nocardia puris TaxID=208602 RepID=UPI002E1DC95B
MSRTGNRSIVRFKFGPDFAPQTVAEFKRVRGLPQSPLLHPTPGLVAGRVEAFKRTVNEIVPRGTIVSIWPAIEMATMLAHVAPDRFGPESGVAYTTDRGANTVRAKTLRRANGNFDIVVHGDCFVNMREDSEENVEVKTRLLAHLAAHEPQHIVLALAGLDSDDVAEAARGESPTVNDLLPAVAEAVTEYQCEVAANRIAVSPFPHDAASLADDLAKFRQSLTVSVNTADSDRYQACITVLTAAKELVKGVAYAAAYRFYDDLGDRSSPDPKPEQWDYYISELWPDLLDLFAAVPAAGEPIEAVALGATVYAMTERVLHWLEDIGVTYLVEIENDEWLRSCWWDVPEPI